MDDYRDMDEAIKREQIKRMAAMIKKLDDAIERGKSQLTGIYGGRCG